MADSEDDDPLPGSAIDVPSESDEEMFSTLVEGQVEQGTSSAIAAASSENDDDAAIRLYQAGIERLEREVAALARKQRIAEIVAANAKKSLRVVKQPSLREAQRQQRQHKAAPVAPEKPRNSSQFKRSDHPHHQSRNSAQLGSSQGNKAAEKTPAVQTLQPGASHWTCNRCDHTNILRPAFGRYLELPESPKSLLKSAHGDPDPDEMTLRIPPTISGHRIRVKPPSPPPPQSWRPSTRPYGGKLYRDTSRIETDFIMSNDFVHDVNEMLDTIHNWSRAEADAIQSSFADDFLNEGRKISFHAFFRDGSQHWTVKIKNCDPYRPHLPGDPGRPWLDIHQPDVQRSEEDLRKVVCTKCGFTHIVKVLRPVKISENARMPPSSRPGSLHTPSSRSSSPSIASSPLDEASLSPASPHPRLRELSPTGNISATPSLPPASPRLRHRKLSPTRSTNASPTNQSGRAVMPPPSSHKHQQGQENLPTTASKPASSDNVSRAPPASTRPRLRELQWLESMETSLENRVHRALMSPPLNPRRQQEQNFVPLTASDPTISDDVSPIPPPSPRPRNMELPRPPLESINASLGDQSHREAMPPPPSPRRQQGQEVLRLTASNLAIVPVDKAALVPPASPRPRNRQLILYNNTNRLLSRRPTQIPLRATTRYHPSSTTPKKSYFGKVLPTCATQVTTPTAPPPKGLPKPQTADTQSPTSPSKHPKKALKRPKKTHPRIEAYQVSPIAH